MQVNALFKKSAPAPAKTATKTVKKSAPVKKTVAPKAKPVKKSAPRAAPRKAAPTKVAKGDALAKWYGAYRFVRFVGFSRRRAPV
jgi:light-harvesting complex II chlorophyll a/b binding protein 5